MVWPTLLYSSFTLLFISSRPGSALEPLIQLVTSTLDTKHKILTRRSLNFLPFKATNKHNKSPPCLFARLPVTPTHPAFSLKHFAQLSSSVCTPLVTVQTVNHNHRGSLFIGSLKASLCWSVSTSEDGCLLRVWSTSEQPPFLHTHISFTLTPFPTLNPSCRCLTLPFSLFTSFTSLFSTKRNHFFHPKPAHYL